MTYGERVAALLRRVEAIRDAAARGDHERAHSLEDRLRADILAVIAFEGLRLGSSCATRELRAAELAAIALSTASIDFDRWTA